MAMSIANMPTSPTSNDLLPPPPIDQVLSQNQVSSDFIPAPPRLSQILGVPSDSAQAAAFSNIPTNIPAASNMPPPPILNLPPPPPPPIMNLPPPPALTESFISQKGDEGRLKHAMSMGP